MIRLGTSGIFVEREKVGTLFFLLSGGEHSSFYSQRDSGSIRATRKVSSPLEISGKKRKWGTHFNPDEFAKPPSISVFFAQLDFLFFSPGLSRAKVSRRLTSLDETEERAFPPSPKVNG